MRRTGSVSVFWNTFIYQVFLKSCRHSGTSECNGSPRTVSLSRFLLVFFFSISCGLCAEFPRSSSLILSLVADAGCSVGVTASCSEDVGEASFGELEDLVGRPGTTKGTWFDVVPTIFLPFRMRCGFLTSGPMVICTHDLRRVSE